MILTLQLLKFLNKEWPQAYFQEDAQDTEKIVQDIFDKQSSKKSFSLFINGTNFQIKVWQALTLIPKGTTTTYENIARTIDKPKAVRATANAITIVLSKANDNCIMII